MIDTHTCPCGSGAAYGRCCGPYLDAGARPATAEGLMRSRYTAYVLARAEYLRRTWHASTRPASLALAEDAPVKWLGLAIKRVQAGGVQDDAGVVEFVARYKVGGRAERLHEVSRFIKQGGQWFYLDGDHAADD
jgi:SEC-C motif-containing protein